VPVLMRASFIIALDVFNNFMMNCHFPLLIWAVLAIIWSWSLPNRAIFCILPLPCHNTTDWLKHRAAG
jgi:hypothetical protein